MQTNNNTDNTHQTNSFNYPSHVRRPINDRSPFITRGLYVPIDFSSLPKFANMPTDYPSENPIAWKRFLNTTFYERKIALSDIINTNETSDDEMPALEEDSSISKKRSITKEEETHSSKHQRFNEDE